MKKRKKAPPWESESQFPSESESNHGRIVKQKEPSFTSCLRESLWDEWDTALFSNHDQSEQTFEGNLARQGNLR